MNRNGPVIVIEDDLDDQELLKMVFKKSGYVNQLIFFDDGQEALDFLNSSDLTPFIILSDINMPKLDGFGLRSKIRMDAKLQLRCIPYIFFSTALTKNTVIDAYGMSAQGFFKKDDSVAELEHTISVIMEYWRKCASPNNFVV